jgi:tripeptidyl-peptidase-1
VTTVGGTKNVEPEVVAIDENIAFASGGGFSNYFPRPTYQADHVPDYIKSLNGQFDGLYNASGRGYPDISAQGYRYVVIWNGTLHGLDGTR